MCSEHALWYKVDTCGQETLLDADGCSRPTWTGTVHRNDELGCCHLLRYLLQLRASYVKLICNRISEAWLQWFFMCSWSLAVTCKAFRRERGHAVCASLGRIRTYIPHAHMNADTYSVNLCRASEKTRYAHVYAHACVCVYVRVYVH